MSEEIHITMTLISDLIAKHRPKIIWLSPMQMREFKTNFTLGEWMLAEISTETKYGAVYCGTEILQKPFRPIDHCDEIDLSNNQITLEKSFL